MAQQRLRIYQHPAFAAHQPPSDHAESPKRWAAISAALASLDESQFDILEAPLASDEAIQQLHPKSYWQDLKKREPAAGGSVVQLDPDTWLGHGSIEAAARGAGAVLAATDYAWQGRFAFCAARPPGHHAALASPMGFCLINPIALGAHHACQQLGAKKVAIVDFDVHHGNGTQDIFAENPQVLYASSHQAPLYPGTGHADETGVGNLINRPLPPNTGSAEFRALWQDDILPRVAEFQPEMLFISAGFDAHTNDPLAQLDLNTDDYHWLGEQLGLWAQQHCQGRLVAMSEGGYDIPSLEQAVNAFIHALNAVA
ncbi:MAG: histone deacetylase family protein [Xanthomonadales bacterium]|nr:histone deacetylase family protein [Xanthomonadales bacterium]